MDGLEKKKFQVGHLVYDTRLQNQTEPFKVANTPRAGIYNLCQQHSNIPVDNVIDGGREFKEVYLRRFQ